MAVIAQGHASHPGQVTTVTGDQAVNLITREGTATYTLTAANGDTAVLALEFSTVFLPPLVHLKAPIS